MKLSQWHDGSVNPVHIGVYDVDEYYSYFDGDKFRGHWESIELAYQYKNFIGLGSTTIRWRGIVKDKK